MAPRSDRREALTEAALEVAATHGLTDLSLRQLAELVGTSHRMLIHHFGSKEEVWTAVVQEVERRQVEAMQRTAPGSDLELATVLRERWRAVADPELWPSERLFFEVYVRALNGAPGTEGFLDNVVESWLGPATDAAETLGMGRDEARTFARLAVAVTRGLLLDLLATGDRAAVDAAMDAWISSVSATYRSTAHR
jgi:AcrR family transcriptional regulator